MTPKFGVMSKAAACLIAFVGSAEAGSLADPIVEAPISVIEDFDWQGFRLGLTYNSEISSNTFATSEDVPYINTGNAAFDGLGGFIGYDFQRGNFIYGLEVQSLPRNNAVQGFPTRVHKDLHSVRARFGYSTGKTLFYGVAGFASSEFDDAGSIIDMNGYVAGLGVELKIGKNAFVGFGIDHYELSGERIANAIDAKHTIAQVRIGYVF